jgi:hypothetical protein
MRAYLTHESEHALSFIVRLGRFDGGIPHRMRFSIRAKFAHSCTDPLTVIEARDTVAATLKGVRQEGLE